MSNYQVEPAGRPQALSKEAIKALRSEQVQGVSRRKVLRTALGVGLLVFITELTVGTIGFIWPAIATGNKSKVLIGTFADVKAQNSSLPINKGFPAYYSAAKAYVMLIDTTRQEFVAGEDADRRRDRRQRARALPALPAPRLQAQPVPQELLVRVPLPRLALRPARDQGPRRPVRPGSQEHGSLLRSRSTRAGPCRSIPSRSPSARSRSPSASPA